MTGYTGMELTRILLDHPGLQLTQVTSRKEAGQPLRKIYPFLQGTDLDVSQIARREPDVDPLVLDRGRARGGRPSPRMK